MACGEIVEKTRRVHASELKKARAAAAGVPAADVRPPHLVGVAFSHHFVRSLKALYKWAAGEEPGLVPRNPFAALRTPPAGRRERVLSRAELRRLYLALSPTYRRLVYLMVHTTMRPGEVRGLTWGQIDADKRSVCLTKFKAKRMRRDGLKARYVPLVPTAARLLANLRRRRPGDGLEAPVLRNAAGRPLSGNALRCAIRRARARAGLEPAADGERIVCYSLRHTSATNRIRAGLAENVLSKIMGHTNAQMTRRYQHLQPGDLVAALDKLGR